ncbi:MAG: hypothetical protein II502_04370 [Paludibacteraceae bacterium]|nr:hypothetical protein [Paludibacteraceae bacterium]
MNPNFETDLIPLVAVILTLGIPIVAVVMVFITKMKKDKQQKVIRQLIIENKTDPEIAKVLIDEPKKKLDERFQNLRGACVLLGVGLGTLINWLCGVDKGDIYFWLLIAFGIGVGLLCSFFAEMYLKKQQNNPSEPSNEP